MFPNGGAVYIKMIKKDHLICYCISTIGTVRHYA